MINFSFKQFGKLFFAPAIFAVLCIASCQDDPELNPNGDGNPLNNVKTKAFITLVQLNSFPDFDPLGNNWDTINEAAFDTFGRADIFFNITDPSPNPPILWNQGSHFSNVKSTDTTSFSLLNEYQVVPFGSAIDLNIYDYELPDSTLMGTVNFTIGPQSGNIPYPSYITNSNNGYTVTIGIRWE